MMSSVNKQTLSDERFGEDVLKEAKVIDGEEDGEVLFHYKVDVLWWHIASRAIPSTASKRLKYLPKVVELIISPIYTTENLWHGSDKSGMCTKKTEKSVYYLPRAHTCTNTLVLSRGPLLAKLPTYPYIARSLTPSSS